MKIVKAFIFLVVLITAVFSSGQMQPNLDNGFKPYGSYSGSHIDTVDLQNGNLILHIPMPFSYPQRGGKLANDTLLTVSSKSWMVGQVSSSDFTQYWTPVWAGGANGNIGRVGTGVGFASTSDLTLSRFTEMDNTPSVSTFGYYLSSWDGAVHQLHVPSNSPVDPTGAPLIFDAADNSGYHVELTRTVPGDGNIEPVAGVITDRQGTRFYFDRFASHCAPGGTTGISSAIVAGGGPVSGAYSAIEYKDVDWIMILGPLTFSGTQEVATRSIQWAPMQDTTPTGMLGGTSITDCQDAALVTEIVDTDGNAISTRWSDTPVDTMGRVNAIDLQHSTSTIDYSGCVSPNPATPISQAQIYNYTGFGGAPMQMKVCSASFLSQTGFGVPGVLEFQDGLARMGQTNTAFPLVVTVVFSDAPQWTGTRWTFNYDSYLNVTDIGLPTGGAIHYDWTTISQPSCGGPTAASRAVAARTVSDNHAGSFRTSYTWGTATRQTLSNTVTDPLLNDTVHTFTAQGGTDSCIFFETRTQAYQGAQSGSNLLRQVDTTYTPGPVFIDTTANGGLGNILPATITTTLANGNVSRVTRAYDSGPDPGGGVPVFGNVITEQETDWGQGAPGPVLRQIETAYQWQANVTGSGPYLTAHMIDLPARTVVKDGSGCMMAETVFGYDEIALASSGLGTAQQLNPAPNPVRGNHTSSSKWLAPLSSATCVQAPSVTAAVTVPSPAVTSHNAWFDSGELYQLSDPQGHATTHSYDLVYRGAYSTTTCGSATGTVQHCVSGTYDFTTGLLTSFTNENATSKASGNTPGDAAHASNYTYDSMSRMTLAQAPPDPANNNALAQTSFIYSAPNIFPVTAQRQKTITASLTDVFTSTADGLGRTYRTQHATPSGNATVDTTFDVAGRVASVSNPYFSTTDTTYGLTQTAYDALDRATQVTKQDGVVSTVDYSLGNCTTSTDEAGKPRRGCKDGLGRLVEVDEPNPGAAATFAGGSVTLAGAEQSANSQPAISGSGTVTISGTERYIIGTCTRSGCNKIWDTGTVTITVNGFSKAVSYGSADTPSTIAGNLASAFNLDGASPVNASASTNVVTLTAYARGLASNYSLSVSSATTDATDFGGASFTAAPSAATLTGGRDASSTPDTGTVTITINRTPYSTSYGASDTANSIALRLAGLISAGGFGNGSANGGTVNVTAKSAGAVGNYALSAAYTWNGAQFANPSFTTSISGTALTGGFDASALNNNPLVTLYEYDGLGNLLCVEQHGGVLPGTPGATGCAALSTSDATSPWRVRRFTYDSLGRLLTSTNPESGTICYGVWVSGSCVNGYDADGNLLMKTTPAPNQTAAATQTISYCYDALHRLTDRDYQSHTYTGTTCPITVPVVHYAYDQGANGIGHLSSMTDQAGTGTYSYDILGRLASEQRTLPGGSGLVSKTFSYDYNLDGSVKALHYPSGAVITYTPDTAGRILSVVDIGNAINYLTGATYGPDNALTGFVSGNSRSFAGITNSFSYNKRLQPVNMSAASPTQTVFSISYDFHLGNGNNGNVWGIANYKDTSRSQSFTYDVLNRLASAQNAGTDCTKTVLGNLKEYWGNTYTYDAWGNLTNKTKITTACAGEGLSVTVGSNNRITTAGYGYDGPGNMTIDGLGNHYSYDQENRITGAGGYTYTYDGDGNRVRKSISNTTPTGTLYWYMTPGIVAESDLAGSTTSEYVFFGSERVARRDGANGASGVFYYFSDHLKTASVITDSAGTIKAESDYYPWGGELQFVNNDTNHYKFTGKERDSESGFDYFGARYYSNGLGRFISADWSATPIPVPYADFSDPQSLNLYTYVRNIPTSNADANGHCDPLNPICLFSGVANGILRDGGGTPYLKNVGKGFLKGTGSFSFNTAKMLEAGFQDPVQALATIMRPEPALLQPSNETQAQASIITQGALTVGTMVAPGLVAEATEGGVVGAVGRYEVGTFGQLSARSVVGDGLTIDHIPSNASNIARVETALGRELTAAEKAAVRDQGAAVAVPESLHRSASPTYGGRNTAAQIQADAANPQAAAARDTRAMVNAASAADRAKAQAAAAKIRQAGGNQ